jgi:RND family efflux transporter MFP subunit
MRISSASKQLLVCTLLVFPAGCEEEKPAAAAEVLRPVRTLRLETSGGERTRLFSGVTQAGMESRLSFKVSGSINTLNAKVGQGVKQGQLIAELDDQDFRLQVQQAQASYAQARAQLVNARAAYSRAQKLYEASSASRSDLDSARAAAASARAAVAAAAKQIELARSQLTYCKLKAPTDGTIAMVSAEVGENVIPGKTVAVVSAGGRPEVKVTVPEAYISQIRQGQSVMVSFPARKGEAVPATVTEVGVTAGGMGATYPVVAAFDSPPAMVRPGMAAEVAFKLGGGGGAGKFLVPPVAVSEDRGGKRYVYLALPGDKGLAVVRRREVEVGELTSAGLEVTRGVKEGELLVTAGMSQIRDGLRVKLMIGADR